MANEAEAMLRGQAEIWQCMFHFVDSIALKCALDLGIADIIQARGCPITLSQIANDVASSPSLDIAHLSRLMRFLVHKKLFDATNPRSDSDSEEETLYSLNHCSKWLLRDPQQLSLVPLLCLLQYHPLLTAPYKFLSRSIQEGGNAFHMAHGRELWDFASVDPELNKVFNDGMECTARITIKALISEYKHGFDCIGSLVDVGGGTGASIAEIVKAYPHVKGTNFDLPHVVATAPPCPGVNHVGGDMFSNIPATDAIFMKWILHNWSDEDCVKILRNCRKAIPEKTGKIVIVDTILQPGGDGLFDNIGMALDLVMLTLFGGGKERTELEWKKILNEGGFVRYNIIKIPAFQKELSSVASTAAQLQLFFSSSAAIG
ncbi:hypothetical protein TEA_007421 [Camellia sinensis var. sinensis]|uniref:Uncharacterized protein n=1 Tax=Camellia sinensis var. sinensis TaxID=542762 RepID=A0A4S4EBT4_CAMSN|nr:hypothetical protein TEA_007421 [Camellia sinensis var. sinensis]